MHVSRLHHIFTYKLLIHKPILFIMCVDGFGAWDSSSCRVLNETTEEVECGCDHLTHFAILLVSGNLEGMLRLLAIHLYVIVLMHLYSRLVQ